MANGFHAITIAVIGVAAVGSGNALEPVPDIADNPQDCLSALSPPSKTFDQVTNPINIQGWIVICGAVVSEPQKCHKWRPGETDWVVHSTMKSSHGCRGLANVGKDGAAVLGAQGKSRSFEMFQNGSWEKTKKVFDIGKRKE